MKLSLKILLAISILAIVTQCKKEEESNNNSSGETPTVKAEIISPNENTPQLMSMDTVELEVLFTDPEQLHNYAIRAINTNTGDTLYNQTGHEHSSEVRFTDAFIIMVTDHSEVLFQAQCSNHLGDIATQEITLHVHPMGQSGH